MRIAISGSHLVGKTTLCETLTEVLPHYQLFPEPYRLLEEDGHEFGEMPSVEEFELQMERSFLVLREGGADAVFDRCPLDIAAYLLTHEDADTFDIELWMPRIREHVSTLDLIVFVPIEAPDRVDVPRSERGLRAEVDALLSDIVLGDAYGLDVEVMEVAGSLDARVRQVVARVRS